MLKIQAAVAMILGAIITIFACINIWCLARSGAIDASCQSIGGIWAFQFFFFGFLPMAVILFFKKWWWQMPPQEVLIYTLVIGAAFGLLYPVSALLHVQLIKAYDINVGRIAFNLFPLMIILLAVIPPIRYLANKNS